MKLGQGYVFTCVCDSLHGGVVGWYPSMWYPSMPCSRSPGVYPSMPCRFPGLHPGGKLRGLAGGVSRLTPGGCPGPHPGGCPGPHPGGVSRPTPKGGVQAHTQGVSRPAPGGVSRPTPRGVSQHALRQTIPTATASYSNAFLFKIWFRVM